MQQEFLNQLVLWMVHTDKKSASLHYASFLTLTEVKCFRYSASCCEMLFADWAVKEMVCSIKTFFSCISFLLTSSRFLSQPFPPSLSVLSLSLISDPFFMHYSITLKSHLQCITSSHLSQTHFVLLSPSFSHFDSLLALPQYIMTLSYNSPLHCLLLSLCLFFSHVISH